MQHIRLTRSKTPARPLPATGVRRLAKRRKLPSGRTVSTDTKGSLRSASFRLKSWNPEDKTFEFTLASETPCLNYRFTDDGWGYFDVEEVLPMSALRNIKSLRRAPILNTHRSGKLDDVIGVIEDAWIEGTKLVCRGRLSERPGVADIAADLASGILNKFSVGYRVLKDGKPVERSGKLPLITVISWEAHEASMVPLPADNTAESRSARSLRAITRSLTMKTSEFRKRMAKKFEEFLDEVVEDMSEDDTEAEDEADDEADDEDEDDTPKRSAKKPAARSKSDKGEGELTPAATKAAVRGLREACKRNGRLTEFDAMVEAGAPLSELRGILATSIKTAAAEIDTTVRQGAAKAERKMPRLSDTVAAKKPK